METMLPKYVAVYEGFVEFEKQLNLNAQKGYRVSHLQVTGAEHPEATTHYFALMSLKSSPDIQNGENFKNLNIGEDIKTYIDNGWIPIANYSKHVTLMKVKDDPCEGCERITQDEAYQLVIDAPPERGP